MGQVALQALAQVGNEAGEDVQLTIGHFAVFEQEAQRGGAAVLAAQTLCGKQLWYAH